MLKLRFLAFALGAVLFASCASNSNSGGSKKDSTSKYLEALDKGDYSAAIKILSKQNGGKKNLIRDNYDLAMLYHFAGKYDESIKLMLETDRLMDDAVTKSVTQGILAASINENSVEYGGNPYEYIYINIFNSLNYLGKENEEDAGVEIRRMNDKQKMYLSKYGELLLTDGTTTSSPESEKAYKTLRINPSDVNGQAPRKATEADIFKDSPAARYMSLLLYMREGDISNAELDAKMLYAMNQSFDTKSELSISRGKGRLDVISFTDLIGRRSEERIVLGPFPTFPFVVNDIIVNIPEFDIEFVYPKFEKTGGAVMFTEKDGERRYLLIKNNSGHIGFPKGHIDYGENELETAKREVFEETGLDFVQYGDFRREYTYMTHQRLRRATRLSALRS